MVASHPLSQGAQAGAPKPDEFAESAGLPGDDLSRQILTRLLQRSIAGMDTSILDLQQLMGLPLQKAFAALRALESGKIIDIIDDPSDPFGALLRVRRSGLEILHKQAGKGIGD